MAPDPAAPDPAASLSGARGATAVAPGQPSGDTLHLPRVPAPPSTAFGGDRSRGWLPTLVVLAVIAIYTIGLPAIERSLPHDLALTAGTEVPVGPATVRSPDGWSLDRRAGRPTLAKGAIEVVMEARTGPGPLPTFFDRIAAEISATGNWLVSDAEVVTNARGHRVMVAPATSPTGSGLLAVSVADDGRSGFVLLAKGPGNDLSTEHAAVKAILDSLEMP